MPNLALLALSLCSALRPALADFWYMRSAAFCGHMRCHRDDYFHYYNCNDANDCDFHLQPWLYVVISIIVLSCLLTIFCGLLQCICCPRER